MRTTTVFAQQQQQQTSNDTNLVIKAGPLTAVRHVFDDPTLEYSIIVLLIIR